MSDTRLPLRLVDAANDIAFDREHRGSVKNLLREASARIVALEVALAKMGRAYLIEMTDQGADPADAEEDVRETIAPGLWATVRDLHE